MPVMHQAVKAYLANQRQGNAATKTRRYVVGGNQKPWKQKGTGRARAGSTRAPHWRGGGTVFGPIPRSYAQYVPRQVRALARKSALNARARENAIFVIDRFDYDAPKTSRLKALDRSPRRRASRRCSILTDGAKPNVFLSGRNLPTVHVMPYSDVSTYHILWSDVVLIEASAIGHDAGADRRERGPSAAVARQDARREAATAAARKPRRRRPRRRLPRRKAARRSSQARREDRRPQEGGREEAGGQEGRCQEEGK